MFRLLRLLCIALSLSVWLFPVLGQETSTNQRAVRQKNVHSLLNKLSLPVEVPLKALSQPPSIHAHFFASLLFG